MCKKYEFSTSLILFKRKGLFAIMARVVVVVCGFTTIPTFITNAIVIAFNICAVFMWREVVTCAVTVWTIFFF